MQRIGPRRRREFGERIEQEPAIVDRDLLTGIRVEMNAGERRGVDLGEMGRLKHVSTAAARRPFDLAGGGARRNGPVVAGNILPGGEAHLDAVLEIDPRP